MADAGAHFAEKASLTSPRLSTLKVDACVLEKTLHDTRSIGVAEAAWSDADLPRAKKRCDVQLSLPFIILSSSGGQLLCNKEIGRGGHSRCYRLRAPNGKYYAMKAIPRASISAQAARRRLTTEIRIHSQLRHPGVVAFFEVHCITTHWLLVLEHCPNRTLSDWLKKHRRIPEVNACEILLQVFDAVKYLHQRLIFHGDLKLSNILLDAAMKPKLCDFGFAKQLGSVHQKFHNPYGTPSYMAREIIVAPQIFGIEADIWSLGVIMYALLYGVTPFDGRSTDEVYSRIARVDLQFPDMNPTVSSAAKQLIRRMLHVDPKSRATAKDLALDAWPQHCIDAAKPKPVAQLSARGVKGMLEKLQVSGEPTKMKMRIKTLCGKAH